MTDRLIDRLLAAEAGHNITRRPDGVVEVTLFSERRPAVSTRDADWDTAVRSALDTWDVTKPT